MSRVPIGSSGRKDLGLGIPIPKSYFPQYEMTSQFEGAERIADKWGISRDDTDAFGFRSQQNAATAWAEDRFGTQIVPVDAPDVDEEGKPTGTTHTVGPRRGPARDHPREAGRAQAGRPARRRAHRRLVVADLRRRRRRAAHDRRAGRGARPAGPGPHRRHLPRRRRPGAHAHRPDRRHPAPVRAHRPRRRRHRRRRDQRGVRLGRAGLAEGARLHRPSRPTPTAAPSPSATRSAAPAPSCSPRPSTSSSAPAAATASCRCAAAAASAPAPSSSGSRPLAGAGRPDRPPMPRRSPCAAPVGCCSSLLLPHAPAGRRARPMTLPRMPAPAGTARGRAPGRRRHDRRRDRRARRSRCGSSASTPRSRSPRTARWSASAPRPRRAPPSCCRRAPLVRLERDVEARDRYDRLLAYVIRAEDDALREPAARGGGLRRVDRRTRPTPPARASSTRPRPRPAPTGRGLWAACGGTDVPLAPG